MNRRIRNVHLVGIGGVGMSGIAEILHASGYSVTGSDLRSGETVRRLRALGIAVELGHDGRNVAGSDVVVYSAAISRTNPELAEADRRGLPVISRAEMLAELMRMKHGIAVAGSHGKTTTTSMIGTVLQAGGLDPTIVVGGRVRSLGSHSRLGAGDLLVAEADESDGSFLRLLPTTVVITNIDAEHLDHYGGMEPLRQAFADFANRIPFYGLATLCVDDPGARQVLPRIARRTRTYGLSAEAQLVAERIVVDGLETRFDVRCDGARRDEVRIPMPGVHNVRNALAALAIALEFDVPWPDALEALAGFRGVERRFEVRGEAGGVLVIDDYAHHPAEIRATLEAARAGLGRRLLVAFQPHRYSRTESLLKEFAASFSEADTVLLTEIYPAGEEKIPGIDGRALAEATRAAGTKVEFVPEPADLVPSLESLASDGDAVLFLGAGDLNRFVSPLLERLSRRGRQGGDDH